MNRHRAGSFPWRFIAPFALIGVLAACGGSESPGDDSTQSPSAPVTTDGGDSADDASAGRATLTIADGTVYEFVTTTCRTQDTDPSGFPLSNGYEVSGVTSDEGVSIQIIRAGLTDDEAHASGSLEGDFDDEGKNAKMLYRVPAETLELTASADRVTGTLELRAVGPTRGHGDATTATLEAAC